MYCKHCGKEIADDSEFCQHCGGKLDNDIEIIKGEAPNDKILSKLFSNINKKYLYAYIIWVVINTILLVSGGGNIGSTSYFYPFTSGSGYFFNYHYYDSTEFITYVILIPLLVLYNCMFLIKPLKKQIKGSKSKENKNSKLEIALEEPKEITDNPVNQKGQNIINTAELQRSTEEEKQDDRSEDNKHSKKKPSCFTIFIIVATIIVGDWFVRPMAKLYMRQRMNHQTEASGVYGAGLDRAEPIMDKLKKDSPSSLRKFGQLKKVSYGIGTITMEFNNADYDNSPRGDAAKGFVMAEIQAMPNSLKKVMKEIVEEEFSLSIEIHYLEESSEYTVITISPYELGKALNR